MTEATEYQLRRQTEAAKTLVVSLADHDDAELIADAIEGETGLLEAIEAALSEMDECDVLSEGLKAKIETFTARKRSVDERKKRVKALIEQAMLTTEQTSLRLPSATLTIRKNAPGLVIKDESQIPSKFFIEQERPAPKLDKAALAEALKADEKIPGVTLDNGSVSLSVRSK
ncbi:siphovirus Gp157 family protein [Pelagibacterium flavum]|uniref:Siphovirus Gp157 family protein n=1 Tax=Pelagibacterium flavum TaxID=2984530 RepID=A0ABY6IKZ4_9HYPH|nr:siphovirus Gp157 family protein [Pelagibacterium sp. YIM 151497]UYQ71009.1 siphovirus Gp157 family protein [Pelagibacterium sp. YIM 151497]